MTDFEKPKRTVLLPEHKQKLFDLVQSNGLAHVAQLLGIHAQTVTRLAAGLGGHRSVVALVERRLAEVSANDER